jgi:hypothetical protein
MIALEVSFYFLPQEELPHQLDAVLGPSENSKKVP